MSKIDIAAHAEAILGVVLDCEHSGLLAAYVNDDSHRQAILAAVTAVFDAGALAMREDVAKCIDGPCDDGAVDRALSERLCCGGQDCGCMGADVGSWLAYQIRAIDPATLREVCHD